MMATSLLKIDDKPKYPRVTVEFHSQDDELSRRFVLDNTKPHVKIGRASRSGTNLMQAKQDNGWIDSPILSREHAMLMMGQCLTLPLLLRDTGSTHGSFLNSKRMEANTDYVLSNNDLVSFGVPVTSGRQTFQPKCFTIEFKFEKTATAHAPSSAQALKERPRGFRVPSPSDSEGSDSDEAMMTHHAPLRQPSLELLQIKRYPFRAPSEDVVIVSQRPASGQKEQLKSHHIDLTQAESLANQPIVRLDVAKPYENDNAAVNDQKDKEQPKQEVRAGQASQSGNTCQLPEDHFMEDQASSADKEKDQGQVKSIKSAKTDFREAMRRLTEGLGTTTKAFEYANEDSESSASEDDYDEEDAVSEVSNSPPPPPTAMDGSNKDVSASDKNPSQASEPTSDTTVSGVSSAPGVDNPSGKGDESEPAHPNAPIECSAAYKGKPLVVLGYDNGEDDMDSMYESSEASDFSSRGSSHDDSDEDSIMGPSEYTEEEDDSDNAPADNTREMETMPTELISATVRRTDNSSLHVMPNVHRAPSPSDAAMMKSSLPAMPTGSARREQYIPPTAGQNSMSTAGHLPLNEPWYWSQQAIYSTPPIAQAGWLPPNLPDYGRDAAELSFGSHYGNSQDVPFDSSFTPTFYSPPPYPHQNTQIRMDTAFSPRPEVNAKAQPKTSKVQISDIVNETPASPQNNASTSKPSDVDNHSAASVMKGLVPSLADKSADGAKRKNLTLGEYMAKSSAPKRKAAEIEEGVDKLNLTPLSEPAPVAVPSTSLATPVTAGAPHTLSLVGQPAPEDVLKSTTSGIDEQSCKAAQGNPMKASSFSNYAIPSPSAAASRGEPPEKKVKTGNPVAPPAQKPKPRRSRRIKSFVSGCIVGAVGMVGAAAALIATTPMSVQEEALRSL